MSRSLQHFDELRAWWTGVGGSKLTGLATLPEGVLASIVLRRNHCSIHAGPKDSLDSFADSLGAHLNSAEFVCPGIAGLLASIVEVEVANLPFGVPAGLLGIYERQADSRCNLVVLPRFFELDKRAGRNRRRAAAVCLSLEALWLRACAGVLEDTCLLDLRALKVGAKVQRVRSNAERGLESAAAGNAAGTIIDRYVCHTA